MNSLNRLQPFALLVLRLSLGAIMIAHGYKKVFGGFHGHQQMVSSLGIPGWMAYLSAGTEFVGGIGIVLGLATRFFALAFLIEMGSRHRKNTLEEWIDGPGRLRVSTGAGDDCLRADLLRRRSVRVQFWQRRKRASERAAVGVCYETPRNTATVGRRCSSREAAT